MTAADWPCEAYGPEALEHGACCFFSELWQRDCIDPEDCGARMTAERRRVFQRIQEMAAAGEPTAVLLAEDFTSPEQLLGGEQLPPDDE